MISGEIFMQMPEQAIKQLEISATGLKMTGKQKSLHHLIKELEFLKGFKRIIRLCECLELIAQKKDFETVSTQEVNTFQTKIKSTLIKFSIHHRLFS
jgi:hypothetical protein